MEEFVKSLRHPSPLPRWLRWLKQLLPPLCWQCKKVLGGITFLDPASPFLCISCLLELPWTDQAYHCRQCGNHTAEPNRLRCQECIEDIWELDESRSVFAYDDIVLHWIMQLKFYGNEHLSPLLGRLLAMSFQNINWLENMIFSFQFLSTPLVCVQGASISLFFWRITLRTIWVSLYRNYRLIG